MPTRLKKPSIIKHLAITAVLTAFIAYLGTNAMTGQFGIDSQNEMVADISELGARSATLQAEIDALHHRITLLDPQRLDPDLLSEEARRLLAMAHPDDVLIADPAN